MVKDFNISLDIKFDRTINLDYPKLVGIRGEWLMSIEDQFLYNDSEISS